VDNPIGRLIVLLAICAFVALPIRHYAKENGDFNMSFVDRTLMTAVIIFIVAIYVPPRKPAPSTKTPPNASRSTKGPGRPSTQRGQTLLSV